MAEREPQPQDFGITYDDHDIYRGKTPDPSTRLGISLGVGIFLVSFLILFADVPGWRHPNDSNSDMIVGSLILAACITPFLWFPLVFLVQYLIVRFQRNRLLKRPIAPLVELYEEALVAYRAQQKEDERAREEDERKRREEERDLRDKAAQNNIIWLWGSYLNRRDVLILDVEVTRPMKGGGWNTAEIWDIAILDTTGEVRFHAYCDTQMTPPPRARNIRKKQHWRAVHSQISPLLSSATAILAWNAEHDANMLQQTSRRYGLRMPPNLPWRDALEDYRQLRPGVSHELGASFARESPLSEDGTGSVHWASADCRKLLDVMQGIVLQVKSGMVEEVMDTEMEAEWARWEAEMEVKMTDDMLEFTLEKAEEGIKCGTWDEWYFGWWYIERPSHLTYELLYCKRKRLVKLFIDELTTQSYIGITEAGERELERLRSLQHRLE